MCSFFNVEGNTESHSGTVLGLFPTRRVRTTCGLTVRYCSQYDSTNSVSQTSFLTCKPDIMTLRSFSFLASFSRSINRYISETIEYRHFHRSTHPSLVWSPRCSLRHGRLIEINRTWAFHWYQLFRWPLNNDHNAPYISFSWLAVEKWMKINPYHQRHKHGMYNSAIHR